MIIISKTKRGDDCHRGAGLSQQNRCPQKKTGRILRRAKSSVFHLLSAQGANSAGPSLLHVRARWGGSSRRHGSFPPPGACSPRGHGPPGSFHAETGRLLPLLRPEGAGKPRGRGARRGGEGALRERRRRRLGRVGRIPLSGPVNVFFSSRPLPSSNTTRRNALTFLSRRSIWSEWTGRRTPTATWPNPGV